MSATETMHKKKKPVKAPEEKPTREPKDEAIQFGQPIESEKIKVEFDVVTKTITYTLKSTGEVLTKEYENVHALMIIHGRISRAPHGPYTQQCVAKAKIAMLKLMPIV